MRWTHPVRTVGAWLAVWLAPILVGLAAAGGYVLLSSQLADLRDLSDARGVVVDRQGAALTDLDARLEEANDRLVDIGGTPVPTPTGLPVTPIAGRDGDQGVQGPRGYPGPSGTDGQDGAAGPQGLPGARGPAGPTGATGADGSTGAQGQAGEPGPTGPPGPIGPVGPDGQDGLPGSTGPAGPAGRGIVSVDCGSFPEQLSLRFTYSDGTVQDVTCDPPAVDPPPEGETPDP